MVFAVQRAANFAHESVCRIPLPTHIKRFTILKSAHVHKKHRSQYESRMHKRLVEFRQLNGEAAQVFLDYVLRNIPPGVDARLTMRSLEPLPEDLAAALASPPVAATARS